MEYGSEAFPLSRAQRRVWFAEQFKDVGASYVLDACVRLSGPLDIEAMEAALHDLVERHPMLNARFGSTADGEPAQWIAPQPVALRRVRVQGNSPDTREAAAVRAAEEELARPLDIMNGPVFVPSLIAIGPEDHLLVIAYHHLVGDGTSSRLLRRDLMMLYARRLGTDAPPPSVSPRHFREAVATELSEGTQDARRGHLEATLKRLDGAPATSTIPLDQKRPERTRPAAHWVPISLPDDLTQAVRRLARAQQATPFIVYSVALHLLIQRYTGQRDTLVGFMRDVRDRGSRDTVGFLSETLVQRLDCQRVGDAGPTVAEAIKALRDDVQAAMTHSRAPMEEIVDARAGGGTGGAGGRARGGAGGSHHPLFQTMLNYFDLGGRTEVAGVTADPVVVATPVGWLDLEIRFTHRGGSELEGHLRCPSALFEVGTAERLARHFTRLLTAMTDRPDTRVEALPLLDDAETRQVLAAGTGASDPHDGTLARLLLAKLNDPNIGQNPAIRYDGATVTYADLARRVAAIAAHLRQLGVSPDDLVAVSAARSPELVMALVGVVLAGAAFVPLSPDDPEGRTEFVLRDLTPAAVLVSSDLFPSVRGRVSRSVDSVPVLRIEDLVRCPGGESGAELPGYADPRPDNLSYVIYTSGSTGVPKAVGNTHRGIVNRLRWMQDAYPLSTSDSVLQKTPYTFDVSVWEFFWPLITGARLVLARPGGHRDAAYLGELIRTEDVTVAHFVPSMLRAFVESGELSPSLPLRDVICSGEALSPSLCRTVLSAGPFRLHNLYGPTEAAIDVTAHTCTPADADATSVPIGKAVPNTRVHVLDSQGRPQPFGGVGELFLGGVQLARGYLNRPDLTKERFVPDPCEADTSLYRTGDLARMRPDGVVEFLGRTDRQLKLRGFRVEPAEIEAAIESVPGVRQAVVHFDEGDGPAGRGLVAFYRASDEVTPEAVRAVLGNRLPDHMVPGRYRRIDSVPLLTTGKVDHAALASLDATEPVVRTGSGAEPSGPVETTLLDLVRDIVANPAVGADDSFFAVGGDSIRSIYLVARARTAGLHIDVDQVFTHPSVRRLATVARHLNATSTLDAARVAPERFELVDPAVRAALPDSVVDAFPLSPTLAGLVVESSQGARYRVYLTSLRLRGDFDEARLRRAAARVFRRHPFLRSALWNPGEVGEALHVVYGEVSVPLQVADLRHLTPRVRDAELADWARAEERTRFDWGRPPLARLTVHLLADGEFQVTLSEPFLDGYSASLVLTELLECYASSSAAFSGGSGDADREVHGYADFVALQRAGSDRSRDFWLAKVADAPTTRITPELAPADADPTVDHVETVIPADVATALRALNGRTGIPLKSMLLAAHIRVLAALTAQQEVVTALMANTRPETSDGAEAVGLFLNPNPLRVALRRGTWWDLVEQTHQAEAETLPHRAYPYTRLMRERAVDGISTLFNFTHFHPYDRIERNDQLRVLERSANDHTYFPMTAQFQVDPLSRDLVLRLEFFDSAPSRHGQQRILEAYRTAIMRLATAPYERHDSDPLLADSEHHTQRQLAGAPSVPLRHLYSLYAEQAERTPWKTALRWQGGDWSYAQLSERAHQVAAALQTAELRPSDPVGVCLPRSPGLVAALIGVLAAGGVYTPLDPSLSVTRRGALAAAAGCRVVLVDGSTADFAPPASRQIRIDHLPQEPAPALTTPADDPRQAAYLIFTSGSTGTPKGVLVPHSSVHNRLRWGWRTAPFEADEVVCARTPIAFVDSVAELLAGLLSGIPTYLVPDDVLDPPELGRALGQARVTRITLVPTLLNEVLRSGLDLATELPSLRHWTLSGEPLPTATALELLRRSPGATIRNLYGSSEVAGDVSGYEVRGDETGSAIPIGRPVDGCVLSVVDPWDNPVPRGVTGELVVSGAGVGLGYWHDPELTAERFVPDKWSTVDGPEGPDGPGLAPAASGRAFRTGDLVRIGARGELEYVGRVDRQLKVRGVRLEPAEIEAALRLVPGVRDAVVTAGPDGPHPSQAGCGAVLLLGEGTGSPDPRQLRQLVREQVSDAAVPGVFGVVSAFPLTATGKVDHAALWQRARRLEAKPTAGQWPATPVERALASLWSARLGRDSIRRDEDFFALGAHSLHAVMLSSAIRHQFGVNLTITDIFNHPVLAEQAELIEERLAAARTMDRATGRPGQRQRPRQRGERPAVKAAKPSLLSSEAKTGGTSAS